MKILELELKLCRRLSLRNINYLKLTMVEIMQLILGTNGCGKSSLVREANMLPADKADFLKGGFKRVKCEHNGDIYVAMSSFENGQKHSLIRMSDGAELNDGGTVTVQKELVYQLFGETRDIRNLVDGAPNELFTRMSTMRRREWLTKLCVVDYTFAISVYKKAQEQLSYAKGYVKTLKSRFIAESSKVLNEEQIRILREGHAKLTKETQQLYLLRSAAAPQTSEVKERSSYLQGLLSTLNDQYKTARSILKDKFWHHPDFLRDCLNDDIAAVAVKQSKYEMACQAYEELTKDNDVDAKLVTPEELQEMMERAIEIDKKITKTESFRKLSLEWSDPIAASNSLTSIFEDVRDIFLVIFENPDRKYNSDRHRELIELHDKLVTSIKVTEEKAGTLRHQIGHLDALANKENIECPECDHEWKLGYDATMHEQLKAHLQTAVEYIEMRQRELAVCKQELDDSTKYMEHMKQILQTMRYTTYLQPLWDLMIEDDTIRKYPRQCATYMEMARTDLMHDLQISAMRQEFLDVQQKVRQAKESQTEAHAQKVKAIERAEREIGYAAGELRFAQGNLAEMQVFYKEYNNVMALQDRIKNTLADLDKCTQDAVDSIKNEIIDASTAEAMGELAILARDLTQAERQIDIVKDIEGQIIEGEKNRKAFELLVKSLSPVDGIIAEGMLGFIRDYVARMNAFISKIWTYPLEVKDCSLEENSAELNYRFPLVVNNVLPAVSDVSEGSDGMQEIVNLAFRVAAGQCLKLDAGQLVLDEFGRTFDEAHREAATQVIRQIMDQLHYSQFFIISHYSASHGAFYKAQMTVIDKRNITVPAGREYNTHTVIET